jgi:ResB-like family
MSEQNQAETPDTIEVGPSAWIIIQSWLGSLKFSLSVVLLIALACIAGTVIPQGEQVSRFLMKNPGPHKGLEFMTSVGLTNVFYSWWFAALLGVFSLSLMVCTLRRYRMIGRSTGAVRVRVIGSFITHISLLLVLGGGVIRVLWGEKGVLQLSEGETATACESQTGAPMPLSFVVRLVKFDLELYKTQDPPSGDEQDVLYVQWPEKNLLVPIALEETNTPVVVAPGMQAGPDSTFRVKVERYLPDFYLDAASGEAQSRSTMPNNPAVYVSVTGAGVTNSEWVFARFPDFTRHDESGKKMRMPLQFRFVSGGVQSMMGRSQGPVKAFKSTVEFLENGQVMLAKTIAVNSPVTFRGYTFYQLSYNPEDLRWTSLQVVRDPGVPVVYAGFLLMMAGLTVVFCVGPYLDDKKKGSGTAI